MRKALFLDRDGVINRDYGYVHKIESFVYIDGIFDLCRLAKRHNYLIIIVTNQAGIARGYYQESDFALLMNFVKDKFAQEDITIDAIYYCPHHPEFSEAEYRNCNCRKPAPGMLLKAAKDLSINLAESIIIGDKISDIEAGQAAGLKQSILFDEISSKLIDLPIDW